MIANIASTFESTVLSGAIRFLNRRGHVVEQIVPHGEGPFDLVTRDGEVLVFTVVRGARGDEFPVERLAREEAEAFAIRWVAEHASIGEATVRFDVVSLVVLDGGRALIRHHVGVLS